MIALVSSEIAGLPGEVFSVADKAAQYFLNLSMDFCIRTAGLKLGD